MFGTRATLSNWTYLWISAEGIRDQWLNDQALRGSFDALSKQLRDAGMTVASCTRGMHMTVDGKNAQVEINSTVRRFMSTPEMSSPKLILVILPGINANIYNIAKLACDVKYGLLNVSVQASKSANANAQYHADIALRFNLKLGGKDQLLHPSRPSIISEGMTMVIGIDVTHSAPDPSDSAPSIASIVASTGPTLVQLPAALCIQAGRYLFNSRLQLWHHEK